MAQWHMFACIFHPINSIDWQRHQHVLFTGVCNFFNANAAVFMHFNLSFKSLSNLYPDFREKNFKNMLFTAFLFDFQLYKGHRKTFIVSGRQVEGGSITRRW